MGTYSSKPSLIDKQTINQLFDAKPRAKELFDRHKSPDGTITIAVFHKIIPGFSSKAIKPLFSVLQLKEEKLDLEAFKELFAHIYTPNKHIKARIAAEIVFVKNEKLETRTISDKLSQIMGEGDDFHIFFKNSYPSESTISKAEFTETAAKYPKIALFLGINPEKSAVSLLKSTKQEPKAEIVEVSF